MNGAFALAGSIPGNTARTFNLVTLFFGLGGMATPFVAANIFKMDSVNLCRFAGLVALATFAIHAAVRMPPARIGFQLANTGRVVHSGVFWLLAGMLFLYASAESGVWNWMPRHLIAQGIASNQALNILSLGFAPGIAVGRLAVAPVLSRVTPEVVTLGAALAMAVALLLAVRSRTAKTAGIAVFCAGLSMAPVFPTVNAMAGANQAFEGVHATAMGLCQTLGWIGLAVSSGIIGGIAGADAKRLRKALLILPLFSILIAVAAAVVIRF